MSWLFCGSDVNSFMLLFRRFSIDQSHAASIMVSTRRSTTIPVYIIKSLQNSGIRFSWVWAFAAGFTIKSSAMFLDLLSILLLSSGNLQNLSSHTSWFFLRLQKSNHVKPAWLSDMENFQYYHVQTTQLSRSWSENLSRSVHVLTSQLWTKRETSKIAWLLPATRVYLQLD